MARGAILAGSFLALCFSTAAGKNKKADDGNTVKVEKKHVSGGVDSGSAPVTNGKGKGASQFFPPAAAALLDTLPMTNPIFRTVMGVVLGLVVLVSFNKVTGLNGKSQLEKSGGYKAVRPHDPLEDYTGPRNADGGRWIDTAAGCIIKRPTARCPDYGVDLTQAVRVPRAAGGPAGAAAGAAAAGGAAPKKAPYHPPNADGGRWTDTVQGAIIKAPSAQCPYPDAADAAVAAAPGGRAAARRAVVAALPGRNPDGGRAADTIRGIAMQMPTARCPTYADAQPPPKPAAAPQPPSPAAEPMPTGPTGAPTGGHAPPPRYAAVPQATRTPRLTMGQTVRPSALGSSLAHIRDLFPSGSGEVVGFSRYGDPQIRVGTFPKKVVALSARHLSVA